MTHVDWNSVGRGAVLALAVALPVIVSWEAILAGFDVSDDTNWTFVPYLAVMAALVAGGERAARRHFDTPLTHGALAALVAYSAIALVSVIVDIVRDNPLNAGTVVFNFLMSASAGIFGGLLAIRRGRLRHRQAGEAS